MGPISSPVSQKYLACTTGSRWIGCHTHMATKNQCNVLGFPSWVPGLWEWDGSQLWHRNIEIPVHWHISYNNSILGPDGWQWLLVFTEHCRDRTSLSISCMFDTCIVGLSWGLQLFLGIIINPVKLKTLFFLLFYCLCEVSFALCVSQPPAQPIWVLSQQRSVMLAAGKWEFLF